MQVLGVYHTDKIQKVRADKPGMNREWKLGRTWDSNQQQKDSDTLTAWRNFV